MDTQKRNYKLDIEKLKTDKSKYPYKRIVDYPSKYYNTTNDDVKAHYVEQLIDKNKKEESELTKQYRRDFLIPQAKQSNKKFREDKKKSEDSKRLRELAVETIEKVETIYEDIYNEFYQHLQEMDTEDNILFISQNSSSPYLINAKYFNDKMVEAGYKPKQRAEIHASIAIINQFSKIFYQRFEQIKDYLWSENMTKEVLTTAVQDINEEFFSWKNIKDEIIYIYIEKIRRTFVSIDFKLRKFEQQFKESYNSVVKNINEKSDVNSSLISFDKDAMTMSLNEETINSLIVLNGYILYNRAQKNIVQKINSLLIKLQNYYSKTLLIVNEQNISGLTNELYEYINNIDKLINLIIKNHNILIDNINKEKKIFKSDIDTKVDSRGGTNLKYKSTGQEVYILYKKRKYKRTIYVKEKRNTKYCKINNDYILLSKLNVIE